MPRIVATTAAAAILAAGIAALPAQAMPAAGLSVPGARAHTASIVDKAGWRWRYYGYHRYWWRRWRRY
jgi:hypothetical protein